MSRMVLSREAGEAGLVVKVIDSSQGGSMRPNTASIAEMVSAAVFPCERVASRDPRFR